MLFHLNLEKQNKTKNCPSLSSQGSFDSYTSVSTPTPSGAPLATKITCPNRGLRSKCQGLINADPAVPQQHHVFPQVAPHWTQFNPVACPAQGQHFREQKREVPGQGQRPGAGHTKSLTRHREANNKGGRT